MKFHTYLLPPEPDPLVVDDGGADGEVRDGERGAHEGGHVRLHGEHRIDEEDDDDQLPDAVGLNKVRSVVLAGDAVVGGEAGQGEGEGEEEDGVADVVQVDVLHRLRGKEKGMNETRDLP